MKRVGLSPGFAGFFVTGALLMLGFHWPLSAGEHSVSNVKADEEIVFFPTLAWQSSDGCWHVPIHGCVWEPEPRKLALAVLKAGLQLRHVEMSPGEEAILAERARLFMVDNERRKRVVVQVGNERYTMDKTGSDGWFRSEVVLSGKDPGAVFRSGMRSLSFRACLPEGDPRVFGGTAMLVENAGLVVVSDIDDTIKVSQVTDRNALLRATFLEQFRPVPGMSDLYCAWAAEGGCHFCYVSASPWQLFAPLSQFLSSERFPEGTYHLRQFNWNRRSIASLFDTPEKHKLAILEPLFDEFPQRRFVLVGDSGERDPEIYGALARKYKGQVTAIFIRDVGTSASEARLEQAFRGLDRNLWAGFRDPGELPRRLRGLEGSLNSGVPRAN